MSRELFSLIASSSRSKERGSLLRPARSSWTSSRSVTSFGDFSTCSSIAAAKKSICNRASLRDSRRLWQPSRRLILVEEKNSSIDTASTCSSSGSLSGDKTVRFSHDSPTTVKIRSYKYMSPQEKSAIWYSKEEREVIRRSARLDAFKSMSLYPKHVSDMNQMQKNARYLATTLDSVETDRFLRDRKATTKALNDLKGSSARKVAFRGLEDWISPQGHVERTESASESRQMVVQMMRHSSGLHTEVFSEELARDYQHMAQFAVIHARLRGQLDALSANGTSRGAQKISAQTVLRDRVEL